MPNGKVNPTHSNRAVHKTSVMESTTAASKSCFTAEERAWVDLFEEAFMGDVVACLSMAKCLETDPECKVSFC